MRASVAIVELQVQSLGALQPASGEVKPSINCPARRPPPRRRRAGNPPAAISTKVGSRCAIRTSSACRAAVDGKKTVVLIDVKGVTCTSAATRTCPRVTVDVTDSQAAPRENQKR